jgi:protein-disulfide isomerase
MNTQIRNYFLIGIALLALLGVGFIVASTRPQASPSDGGETMNISFTKNGATQNLDLRKVSSNALEGARFISGSSNAKNTIVEFSDYQCPACGAFATRFESQFKTDLIDSGLVRFAYRDFPLSQHANAPLAAQAAACANDGGRFENYKAILFRGQSQWSDSSSEVATERFTEFATFAGLNKNTFLECLKSDSAKAGIEADMRVANQIGLQSTPSFVVNGYLVAGALPVEAFKAILEKVGNK